MMLYETMMANPDLLFLIGALGAYGVALIGVAILVRPLRLEMVDIAEDILRDRSTSAQLRSRVNLLLDTCLSFRVGLILPIAVVSVIFDDLLDRDSSPVEADQRFHDLVLRYLVSVLAANPLAALVTIPLMACRLLIGSLKTGTARDVVEEPALRASKAVPARC